MMVNLGIKEREKTGEIICDKGCGKSFALEDIEILTRPAGEYEGQEVTLHYYLCPLCGHEYKVHYTTPGMVSRLMELNRLKKELAGLIKRANRMQGTAKIKAQAKADKKYRKWETGFNGLLAFQGQLKLHAERRQ